MGIGNRHLHNDPSHWQTSHERGQRPQFSPVSKVYIILYEAGSMKKSENMIYTECHIHGSQGSLNVFFSFENKFKVTKNIPHKRLPDSLDDSQYHMTLPYLAQPSYHVSHGSKHIQI